MKRSTLLALSLLLLLLARPALAQRATASVAGSVTDSAQAAVPGAKVAVRNLGTGVERVALSNEVGFYAATALQAGTYSITVSHEGFTTYTVPELTLQVDQQATVNVELKVGAVTETVTVTATAASVDTRSGTLNTVIHQKLITDMPLNGRNLLQLLRATPGTLSAP